MIGITNRHVFISFSSYQENASRLNIFVPPLHAWGLIAPFRTTGLVADPDRAHRLVGQGGDRLGQVLLQEVAYLPVVPVGGDEDLLERWYGSAVLEGDGLDRLAEQLR